MKISYKVVNAFNEMRLDRLIIVYFGKLPQGLIEKNIRSGKIKVTFRTFFEYSEKKYLFSTLNLNILSS